MTLEDKLKQNTPVDDKLAIFKSSAAMLTKRRSKSKRPSKSLNSRSKHSKE